MLQVLKFPIMVEDETLEEYTERCVIPYPFIIADAWKVRKRLQFVLGMASASLYVEVTAGEVTEITAIHFDGSIGVLSEHYKSMVQVEFNKLTKLGDYIFNNKWETIPDFDNDKLNASMEISYRKFRV